MKLAFTGKAITGLVTIVPAHERTFIEEMANFKFSLARSLKLKEVMGYDRHRVVAGPVCSSDLAVAAIEHLLARGVVDREEIGGLILVTQSPDYLMPGTSKVVHGRLGLHHDVFCLDINQGCAGFLVGAMTGFLLLDQPSVEKVLLVNVDVLSRKVSPRDRNSYPLIGDAGSVAVLERRDDAAPVEVRLKVDGARRDALIIPAGGLRHPSDASTGVLTEDAEGNLRALDNLKMDGSAVFNFVLTEVPELIGALLRETETAVKDVDAFLCHQPNRFMLNKLADKLGVPHEKMPSNIVEHFGNSSGVTIPMVAVHNFADRLLAETLRVCLSGFGVGLTWGAMLMELGPLDFCEMIEFNEDEHNG
ncbi:3-oxoacyl-ACP synthase III family protein [Sphingomonas sp. BK580]|uniref:3-oxoacyl-ACP synthase III family protein n=1 Tax=Sphingomonas sp. BK580 TaxID=2586972 RepID=UPI00161DE245|nr:ketoacyl-ACP synthase III [Sphingomonas sp. BK580]MBB3693778.1 3-oxoacyl-[acyl-carrier-protein] synthase-3 [Sphingomonas sp. BK580]